jgi:hypothetical protein
MRPESHTGAEKRPKRAPNRADPPLIARIHATSRLGARCGCSDGAKAEGRYRWKAEGRYR